MLKFSDGQTEGRTDGKRFSKVGKRSRSHVQNSWYNWKGLVIRNTHAKYESFISKDKIVMANVKVFQK